MGTYTTNYNLFMPTVGETGWGELVNGNFSIIDGTMAGLNTRLTICESTDVAYNTRLETLEAGEFESITADLSPSFGVTTEDGFISSVYMTSEIVVVSGSKTAGVTKTYTYKRNPFCNTVTFTATATHSPNAGNTIRAYVTVNNVSVADTGGHTWSGTVTKSGTITLNEGDVITAVYSSGDRYDGANGNVKMSWSGYLFTH